jgi:hypothetical protein
MQKAKKTKITEVDYSWIASSGMHGGRCLTTLLGWKDQVQAHRYLSKLTRDGERVTITAIHSLVKAYKDNGISK